MTDRGAIPSREGALSLKRVLHTVSCAGFWRKQTRRFDSVEIGEPRSVQATRAASFKAEPSSRRDCVGRKAHSPSA